MNAASATPAKWKPYSRYKDSGVEWLGEVPEHWGSVSLRWISRRYAGGTPEKANEDYWDEGTIPWINSGAVNQIMITKPSAYISEQGFHNSNAKWIPKEALVMALAGQGKTKGMTAQLAIDTTCNQSMAAIIPSQRIISRFLFWWLTANYQNIRGLSSGELRDGLNLEILGSIPCPLLLIEEQCAIKDFLDKKTKKIDALIAKKERLIELLQEKRTALISHAVTKGLDPSVPMKDSGVEWLGEIPEKWDAKKIKRLCLVKRGASPRPIDDPIYFDDDGEYSWVRISDVTSSSKYLEKTEQKLSKLGKSKSVALDPGELFLSIAATVGKPIIADIKCCIHDGFVYFVGLKQNREFLFYVFSSVELYKGLGKLGTQLNLNTDTIGDIKIPVPDALEQRSIVVFLDRETAKIDVLSSTIDKGIEKLREYRSTLISAAVTGKIDVRDEVCLGGTA